jgi:DNA-binding NtrC family response regulator
VIIITGSDESESIQEAEKRRLAFLAKPLSLDAVLETVELVIQKIEY